MISASLATALALVAAPGPTLAGPTPVPPAVSVISTREPDHGGAPDDGDLWRQSLTISEQTGTPSTFTRVRVANTPIPDTPENRARWGGPISHGGRATEPHSGRVLSRGAR